MKKIIIILVTLIFILIIAFFSYKYIIPTLSFEYSLKGDYVPSISKVLDERKVVYKYEKSTKNGVYFKKYTYLKQNDVINDIKVYVNYLIKMEQFEVLKAYDLNDPDNKSIYLGKVSHTNSEYIILIDIEYTTDSYEISLSKKKGTLLK
jgi:hypothetical protein